MVQHPLQVSVLINVKKNLTDVLTRQAFFVNATRQTTFYKLYRIINLFILRSPPLFRELEGRPWLLYDGTQRLDPRDSFERIDDLTMDSQTSIQLNLVCPTLREPVEAQ